MGKHWTIELIIEPDEGGFHGFCPLLKGLHTQGDTREETLQHLGDALSAYMESVIRHGLIIEWEEGIEEDLMQDFHWTEEDLAEMRKASSMTYEELFGDI